MQRKLPLQRGVLEAGLILFGILAAFWIDAWWDDRQAELTEDTIVSSVQGELQRNRASLARLVQISTADLTRIVSFISATPDELAQLPPDSMPAWVQAMWLPPTFDPEMAAASVLLDTPVLKSEESIRARRLLAEWVRTVEDAREEGGDLRTRGSEVVDLLAGYAVAGARPGDPGRVLAGQNVTIISETIVRQGPRQLARLRMDDLFVSAIMRKSHTQHRYLGELQRASGFLDSISVVFDAQSSG